MVFLAYFALIELWNRKLHNNKQYMEYSFFHFHRTKNCQLTFLKKLFASNIEHKLHEKSDFINLPKC